MYILNITSPIKKMIFDEVRDFIFDNHYKRIGFRKENSYCSMKHKKKRDLLLLETKLIEKKILDPSNAKENYNSYLKKKIQNW